MVVTNPNTTPSASQPGNASQARWTAAGMPQAASRVRKIGRWLLLAHDASRYASQPSKIDASGCSAGTKHGPCLVVYARR